MTVIEKDKLAVGCWYEGNGRNNNIAFWDGTNFLTFGSKWKQWVEFQESYGCFIPMRKLTVDPNDIFIPSQEIQKIYLKHN